jgi:hypothetical protein
MVLKGLICWQKLWKAFSMSKHLEKKERKNNALISGCGFAVLSALFVALVCVCM